MRAQVKKKHLNAITSIVFGKIVVKFGVKFDYKHSININKELEVGKDIR